MNNKLARILPVIIYLLIVLCLPVSVGINQAFALQYLAGSPAYQDMPHSLGDITVHGFCKYYDRDGVDPVAAKHSLVGIYTATVQEQCLAWGYTNGSGEYTIGPFPNPGTALRVKILAYVNYSTAVGNYEITVAPPGGSTWQNAHSYTMGDFGPYQQDGDKILPLLTVPRSEPNLDAWWIKDDLDDGFLFLLNKIESSFLINKIGDYFAVWQAGWNMPAPADGLYTAAFFDSACCWSPWCQKSEAIHLNSKAAYGADGRDRVIHEMGHAVMYYAYNHYLPCDDWGGINYILTCMNHQVNEARTLECAWIEGWANFWSLAVQNDTSLWGYNLENPTWGSIDWNNGDTVEGRVTGALWDIFDSHDDGWDI